MDLVVLDVHLPQELYLVLGVLVLLVLLVFLVFQGHHVLLASQLVPLVQQPLVVQDSLGLPADLAVREYLVLPVVLPVPEDPEDLEDLGGREDREDLGDREDREDREDLGGREDREDREDLGGLGGRLLAVVDAFHAVLGYSKWQVAIESPK